MADATVERNEAGELVCPECGESFKLAMHLGLHRKNKHGVAGSTPKKRTRSRSTSDSGPARKAQPRKDRIKRTLLEVVDLTDDLRGRETTDLPEHLSDVIRRDADQLATLIASLAEVFNPMKVAVDVSTRVAAPALAASGVLRWLLRAWRRGMEERQEEGPELTPEDFAVETWREPPMFEQPYIPPGTPIVSDDGNT